MKKEWLKPGALVIAASALLVDTEFLSDKKVKLISDNYKMYDGWGSGQPLPTQKNVSTLLGMGFYDAVTEGRIMRESITEKFWQVKRREETTMIKFFFMLSVVCRLKMLHGDMMYI